MQKAYQEKRDLYAEIGSACFHNNYEDNLEHDPRTGEINPEGKARRSKAKTVLFGITYGMSAHTLASRMDLSVDEAKQIIEDFYNGFPNIKSFTEESQQMLREKGYITDIFGRRRHIPNGSLDQYTIKYIGEDTNFNPLLNSKQHIDNKIDVLLNKYKDMMIKARRRDEKNAISTKALADNILIKDNNGFIQRALRQCLNARIQGTASSMTKLAMMMIVNDEKLKQLGFRILITVHDEIIGEAPQEVAEEAGKRLSEVMVEAAKVKCSYTPWSVDAYNVTSWYEDEVCAEVLKVYNKLLKDKTEEEAKLALKSKFPMLSYEKMLKVIDGNFDESKESLKE